MKKKYRILSGKVTSETLDMAQQKPGDRGKQEAYRQGHQPDYLIYQ